MSPDPESSRSRSSRPGSSRSGPHDPLSREGLRGAVPPAERDDVPSSTFAPGVDQPAAEVAGPDEAAEAEDLLDRDARR